MNLANPAALLWAGLAVPIVIFYILKIRMRRVPVSTVLFWRQIFEDKKPRSLWQRLRHLVSLLCQLALLFLLVGALAEPFFSWEIDAARRVVLVVDNSASMNAIDVAPSRLAHAREFGHHVIGALRFRDEMAIVAAGTQPQVICGMTNHQSTLREALDGVAPGDGPTRVAEAVALARRLLDDGGEKARHPGIIVLSDGCGDGSDELAEAADVQIIPVGRRTGNVGITAFQVRRSLLDPVGYEILVEIVNHSDEAVECRFEMDLNGDVIDVVPLKLAAEEKWSQVIEKTSIDGGLLTARIDRPDALAADNRAVALLPKREYQPVTLVSESGNLFLEKVLEANALVRLSVAKTASATAAVTVYHRQAPNPLPAGAVLVIDPANDTDLWKVGDRLQNPLVTRQDRDSPLMSHVRLDNVFMPEARKLSFTEAAGNPQVLVAAANGEPLYCAIDRPEGKVLVLSVNLDKGDLPLRTAFPIMAANALAWFAGGKGELREALATGAVTEVALPAGSSETLVLRGPDGRTRPLPSGVARTTIGPLDQCGIWTVVSSAPGAKPLLEVACNLANRGESDIRPRVQLPEASTATIVSAGFVGRPFWFYLLVAAWLLAAVEWYLYQRRWIS